MATGTVFTGQVEASTAPTADAHVLRMADRGTLLDGGSLVSVDDNYEVASGVQTVVYTGASADDVVTLPDATENTNRLLVLKNAGSDLWTASGDIFDASAESTFLLNPGDAVGLRSDGTRWLVIWTHWSLGSAS